MLVSFSVENFRSFRGEQTLSLVASNRLSAAHSEHCSRLGDTGQKLLPLAVLYGANGAGKSNLVKALRFASDLVLTGTPPKGRIQRQPFLFGSDETGKPSSFEFRILADERIYGYGFTVNEAEIVTEWLYLLDGERETTLFERKTDENGFVEIETGKPLGDADHGKVVALSKVGVRHNQLFLAAIRESVDPKQYGALLKTLLNWFEKQLVIVFPNSVFAGLAELISGDTAFADFAGRFLNEASTGVDQLRVETQEINDSHYEGNPLLAALLDKTSLGEERTVLGENGEELIFERREGKGFVLRRLKTEHVRENGETVVFPLNEESDGTQRLTHLLPALFQLKKDERVYVIDEIDRSLHPLLAKKFIEFFLRACGTHPSQLILTTHETNLLDLNLLRRDEIWFAEKEDCGATHLYSLSEFKVRQDLKIDKGYLDGRFGAIPFLGRIDQLLGPESVASAASLATAS